MDGHVHVVVDVVARRVVALRMAFVVFPSKLAACLANFGIAACDLGKVHDVGVCVAPTGIARDDEALRVLVEHHLHVAAERARDVELGHLLPVGLAVLKLLGDLLDGARASVAEERRKLARALLAQVAVFKLAIAQKPDFAAADAAGFLFEHLSEQPHFAPLSSSPTPYPDNGRSGKSEEAPYGSKRSAKADRTAQVTVREAVKVCVIALYSSDCSPARPMPGMMRPLETACTARRRMLS